MTPPIDDEAQSFAELQDAFAPYLKSPQEAVNIRRLLTLYVGSCVEFGSDAEPSHLNFSLSDSVVRVKEIPRQVTGLRRKYLERLRANLAARRAYDSLVARNAGRDDATCSIELANNSAAPGLRTHLQLLRQRRRYEELQIMHHYAERLSQTHGAQNSLSELTSARQNALSLLEASAVETEPSQQFPPGETADQLMKKLELAVIKAKYQLEREKRLLDEVKAQHDSSSLPPKTITNKLEALSATRNVLVNWLDEKLSIASSETVHLSPNDAEDESGDSESTAAIQDRIMTQYANYIQSRKKLIDTASAFTVIPPQLKPSFGGHRVISSIPQLCPPSRPSALPFISNQLVPLMQQQKAASQHKSYLLSQLSQEKASTMDALERLGDESHLLPTYPLVARQEKFKNAVAALAARTMEKAPSDTGDDEMTRRAEAWAFAAKAAGTATGEMVSAHLQRGHESMRMAESNLAQVRSLLRNHALLAERVADEDDEEDIWVADIHRETKRNRGIRRE